jgi:hypothetical protein
VGQRKCLLAASLESGLVGTLRRPPPSGPVGYRRRGPVIPTPLPRGIRQGLQLDVTRHGLASPRRLWLWKSGSIPVLMARSCNTVAAVPLADFTLDGDGRLDSYHGLRPAKYSFWILG